MERLSDRAIEIINELHTERLDYESEYLPLIDCANKCSEYEDTGLEPETVSKIRDIVLDISGNLDRLRELAEADRERRCVVLPCKVEDDVYINIFGRTLPFTVISISQMASTPTFKAQHGIRLVYIFKADDVGETVFMTREEAEAALAKGST